MNQVGIYLAGLPPAGFLKIKKRNGKAGTEP
jgi:hypothetical protein